MPNDELTELAPDRYAIARPVFGRMPAIHLSLDALLADEAKGSVWVDDPGHPRIAYASSPEGQYLAGDPAAAGAALATTLPHHAYLICDDCDAWATPLRSVWSNRFFRPHARQHWRLRDPLVRDWRERVPDGFEIVPVDGALLEQTQLGNHGAVAAWVGTWRSNEDFLARGLGYVLRTVDTVAAWCIADCVSQDSCEIGIGTDPRFRRRGFATLVAAAAVAQASNRNYDRIGWHCLASNTGSRRVAERIGFVVACEYEALSSAFPAENVGDLTPDVSREWAEHYERAGATEPVYHYYAGVAWAHAGDHDRCLAALGRLAASGAGERG
ncbi:MAG: GNAT family N-acetyltransferase, partial [Planctomycetota bacterium]|nr:GNAT family N-acetyltransferase [Planctomycetota bacterium]